MLRACLSFREAILLLVLPATGSCLLLFAGCGAPAVSEPASDQAATSEVVGTAVARFAADASETSGASETEEIVDPDRYEKQILVRGLHDPMQLNVLPDGQIYFNEILGKIKHFDPKSGEVRLVGEVPSVTYREVGFMGLALDNDFPRNQRIYTLFCPREKKDHLRIARFELKEGRLDLSSQVVMLEYRIDPETAIHMGGGLFMAADGLLYAGTGDNCFPIPELPVDQREGNSNNDALRSSGNSMDLRGCVLRIRPEEDGSYTIPPGNLFSSGEGGRPEIYAMGVRNAFRLYVDPVTNWVYWGDVGPNIRLDLQLGPNGYDEVNQARTAGNYGWPMFTGPNEAYRWWNFETKKRGAWFEVEKPINSSRNNTGLRELPRPQPAFIWYPTGESQDFPELGSGGRAAMTGPIYRFDPRLESPLKLPAVHDGRLLIFDWTRNWIKQVTLDENGNVARIDPFLGQMIFRKPIDMKFRDDGTLYLIEYGDRWNGNTDSQIVRLVYRRGNRPPVSLATADRTAGRHPLRVRFDGGKSHDKDAGDAIAYAWHIRNKLDDVTKSTAPHSDQAATEFTFEQPGVYDAQLTVTDKAGERAATNIEIRVGNTPPVVRILEPPHGSFFDWEEPIAYAAEVEDAEDGSTTDGKIDASRLVVRTHYQQRRRSTDVDTLGQQVLNDDATMEPGLAMMRRTTCFACHTARNASAGPPYELVAQKYQGDDSARERLANKIISGGAGVWGAKPMPPHPQHTLSETRQMVDWVLSLAHSASSAPMPGTEGAFQATNFPDIRADAGVHVITASYTDHGAAGVPPITGEAIHLLHSRKKKAAFFDTRRGAEIVDEYEGESTIVGRFASGDYVSFSEIRLAGIETISIRAGALRQVRGRFEIRQDSPQGPLLAKVELGPEVGYRYTKAPIRDPGGVHDLYVVAVVDDPVAGETTKPGEKLLGLNWIGFHYSAEEELARSERRKEAKRRLAEREVAPAARPFVRNWVRDDLLRSLKKIEESGSAERGQQLFVAGACVSCHRTVTDDEAEKTAKVGPALSEVAARYAKLPNPPEAILDAILEPSTTVADQFRTQIVFLEDGRQLVGLIVEEDAERLTLVTNPLAPDERTVVSRVEIEEVIPSAISMMPQGLLSTFQREEIVDLITFILAAEETGSDDSSVEAE